MKTKNKLIIGTRGSQLALWQANFAAGLLPCPHEIKIIKTSGDRFTDIPLQGQQESGFFTKEIEAQLLQGEIDLAVHSLKDMPTVSHPELMIAAYLPRGSVEDLLLIHPDYYSAQGQSPLKYPCRAGAASLRRQAMLKTFFPNAAAAMLRGNVPARIAKCQAGEYGAIIIAKAGIERLQADIRPLIALELNSSQWITAPGQGVIAVQTRKRDLPIIRTLQNISHSPSEYAAVIERTILANFQGGCHTAFAAHAVWLGNYWQVTVGKTGDNGEWQVHRGNYEFSQAVLLGLPNNPIVFSKAVMPAREELCQPLL